VPELDEKTLMGMLASSHNTAEVMRHVVQVDGKSYDFSRAKMLIKHFLFTRCVPTPPHPTLTHAILINCLLQRILVDNILLSPWQHGVSGKPTHNTRLVVFNLRVVATLMYEILRLNDPAIPKVAHEG
jgi:hypothetical protein